MTTNRPLARLGIADLEEIFIKQGGDLTVLARLKNELSYRQVPRAVALQEKIRKAELKQARDGSSSNSLASSTPNKELEVERLRLQMRSHQLAKGDKPIKTIVEPRGSLVPPQPLKNNDSLPDPSIEVSAEAVKARMKFFDSLPEPEQETPSKPTESGAVPKKKSEGISPSEPTALPQLALEDACKILKVNIGDSWEKIEIARRKIVQKSSPSAIKEQPKDHIQKLLSEAKLANDAAIVIAARRSGRK